MLKTIQAMNYMDNSNMPSAINPVMPYGIISGFNKNVVCQYNQFIVIVLVMS